MARDSTSQVSRCKKSSPLPSIWQQRSSFGCLEDALQAIDGVEFRARRCSIFGRVTRAFELHHDIREAPRFVGVTALLDCWSYAIPLLPEIGGCLSECRSSSGRNTKCELPTVIIEHDDRDGNLGLDLG